MKNNLFGITNIRVKHFSIDREKDNNLTEINNFLEKYNGDIIDIQYQQNNFQNKQILVIYQEK